MGLRCPNGRRPPALSAARSVPGTKRPGMVRDAGSGWLDLKVGLNCFSEGFFPIEMPLTRVDIQQNDARWSRFDQSRDEEKPVLLSSSPQ